MGLVDYSESSGSESEAAPPQKPAPKATPAASKKPSFQKVVDRSNPGKIRVNLSARSEASSNTEEPPTKRAKTSGSGLFSGFNSFLPPPKNTGKPAPAAKSSRAPGVGFQLKTGAEAAFSRDFGNDNTSTTGVELDLPEPMTQSAPSKQEKPEEEVKLVGKPLMFKPLSVARKPAKKGGVKAKTTDATMTQTAGLALGTAKDASIKKPAAEPKKPVSLFGISTEPEDDGPLIRNEAYVPEFAVQEVDYSASYDGHGSHASVASIPDSNPSDLQNIAKDLNLSAAERRELFGREKNSNRNPGSIPTNARVLNFNMDNEYAHNEELRAAGEIQTHNPVRAIAPGKHSLRQLVNQVQTQRDALEESFTKGKANKREAAGRYGW